MKLKEIRKAAISSIITDEGRVINEHAWHKTGDMVYRDGPSIGRNMHGGTIYEPEYGQVTQHSNQTAKVKWPSGETTTHRQSDGRPYGSGPSMSRISLGKNSAIRSGSSHGSPEEHVASVKKYAADAEADRTSANRHHSLTRALAGMHHTHFSTEHLDALQKVHDSVKAAAAERDTSYRKE